MSIVYVDNNATTSILPEVLEAMMPYLTSEYFNPSSMYNASHNAASAIVDARKTVARCLGIRGDANQILFTSCATESNNTAIFGAARAQPDRRHIVTTTVEHPAVLEVCKELARTGYEVSFVPVDENGNIKILDYVKAIRKDTLLVSIMHANNETGVVFPIDELSRIAKETNPSILFHTDATQTVGKMPIDLWGKYPHVDLLSFSGHKIHAPKGIGALFIRRGTPVKAFQIGGHQEGSRRGGTENVAFIVGLAKAIDAVTRSLETDSAHLLALRNRLENGLFAAIPNIQVNGAGANRLPNTTNVSVHFVEGEGMLFGLDEHGICASSGSACTSGSLEPSHVLRAMNVPFTAVHGSVRFSLGTNNTEADVAHILEVFPRVVASLRKLSPYWDQEHNRPRPEAESMMTQAKP